MAGNHAIPGGIEVNQDGRASEANSSPVAIDTETKAVLDSINGKLPAPSTQIPAEQDSLPATRIISSHNVRVSYCKTSASGLLTSEMVQIGSTGTGMTVSQSSGNLVIAAGTTANAEFLARSVESFIGMRRLLQSTVLSQRIAQNNFDVWLADLIGESLPFTINSATSVTVSFPAGTNPFANYVGASVELGAISGAAGIPGTATVASVSGDNTTFTVSGWPASGAGTLCVWGFNAMMLRYQGTTATNASFATRRNGTNAAFTTATITTTASPGHITCSELSHESATLGDRLRASNTGNAWSWRSDSPDNIPSNELPLYVFIRALNGTSNPASSTTWTHGFWDCVESAPLEVDVISRGANSDQRPIAMKQVGTVTTTYSGTQTVTANIGTLKAPTTTFRNSTADTNLANIKSSAGSLYGVTLDNSGAGVAWCKLYNKASAPVLASDTSVLRIEIPAGKTVIAPLPFPGFRFSTGISIAITGAQADTDTTAIAAGQVKASISYI